MNKTLPTLKIGYLPILDHLILPVAEYNQNSQFRNFKLKNREFLSWDGINQSLINGELDAAFLLAPLVIELFRQKHSHKVILLGHREGQVLITIPEIEDIYDLKNKTIHLPHKFSTHHILLAQAFNSEKMNLQKDAKIVFGYDNIKMAADELEKKTTDAYILAEPMGTEAVKRKVGKILTLSQEILPHHVDCVLVVQNKLIEKNPEVVQELVDNFVSAGAFINAYPRQAAEIGAHAFGWPMKTILEALTHHRSHILFWDLIPRLEDFEQLQKLAINTANLWENPIDLRDLIQPQFAQEAYRKLVVDTRKTAKDRGLSNTLPTNTVEAISRLKKINDKPAFAIGVSQIGFGQHYPVQAKKVESIDKNLSQLIKEARNGQNILLPCICGSKALALTRLDKDSIPDSILLKVDNKELEKFEQALTFGGKNHQFKMIKNAEDFLVSDQPSIYKDKDNIYLILSWTAFRFLVLQLENS